MEKIRGDPQSEKIDRVIQLLGQLDNCKLPPCDNFRFLNLLFAFPRVLVSKFVLEQEKIGFGGGAQICVAFFSAPDASQLAIFFFLKTP